MDLIYTNPEREDLGVLFDYEFDLAFGADENNFELKIQASAHCLEQGSFLYIEGTEYGGIVDGMVVDTEDETVTYIGRTWHGILAGNVIEPESGYDYYVATGEGNAVIAELIEYLDLSEIFTASTADSGIKIGSYSFNRYTDAYTGIKKMLAEFDGKLLFEFHRNTVILSAVPRADYSRDEEWDSSQVGFSIKKNFRPVNHLICLGSGNLKNRHVIHLYTDEYGGIQPYKTVENPVEDAEYILDTSGQVMFGVDEVAEVFDYSSAQITENYIKLTEQPDDWVTHYANYFTKDENDAFVSVEGVPEEQSTLLTAKPSDWEEKYGNYCVLVDGKFKAVESVTTDEYKPMSSKPEDWETNYKDYYTYYTDGVTESWRSVGGESMKRYLPQTMKPTDWETNFSRYFYYGCETTYDKDIPTLIIKQEYKYMKIEGDKAPYWFPRAYYTEESYYVAPAWKRDYYHELISTTGAPEWTEGTYYTVQTVIVKPPFAKNNYFVKKIDNFADLVTYGLERLKESFDCDSISIDLELEKGYDIGDVVGATEHTTGISVWQPITKKIVSIANGIESINYEIGVI